MALSSLLGQIMSLKNEIAGAIRAIRSIRGVDYGNLADVIAKSSVGNLEQGKHSITLEKLIELSNSLQFDPVALLALCVSIQNDEPADATIERARAQLALFRAEGGEELLRSQFVGKELKKRPPGKPKNSNNAAAVRELKASGLSQAEIANKLGLAKSTVHRYWQ
jgi:transcriptional regulator with XRE-family HTH domain